MYVKIASVNTTICMQDSHCSAEAAGSDKKSTEHQLSRRSALLAGVTSVAAVQSFSLTPGAQAANQDAVTPVNIAAKETVELGQSGGDVRACKILIWNNQYHRYTSVTKSLTS